MAKNESAVDRVVEKTPWWVVSSFFHLAILMVAGLFFGIQVAAEEDNAVVVSPARRPKPLPVMEPPKIDHFSKKLIEHKEQAENPIIKKAPNEDHPESDEDEKDRKHRGDSSEFDSNRPFLSKASQDAIGTGFTGGGRFGYPSGGNQELTTDGGGDNRTEKAVLSALRWLARHQDRDGSWKAAGYHEECNQVAKFASGPRCQDVPGDPNHDSGVTGLALLAFLGAGYTHQSKNVTYDGIPFGDVVKRGLRWILANQDADGLIGGRVGDRWMYNHLICTLVLTELYGRTEEALLVLEAAQRALDFTIRAQNPEEGWRYTERPGDNDTSVTGWGAMVLKSAELSDLEFPRDQAYAGAMSWFDEVTSRDYYRAGYTFVDSGKTFEIGVNERFDGHPSMTAVAAMSRMFLQKNRRSSEVSLGCSLLVRDLPKWEGDKIDFYYWYYGSLALFQYGGTHWKKWNAAMKEALVPHQNDESKGCRSGSWEPVGRWCRQGARVYSTAINALTLEVYYRYANVFTGR